MRAPLVLCVLLLSLTGSALGQCPSPTSVTEGPSLELATVSVPLIAHTVSTGHTLLLGRDALENTLEQLQSNLSPTGGVRRALFEALDEVGIPAQVLALQQQLHAQSNGGLEVIDGIIYPSAYDGARRGAQRLLEHAVRHAVVGGHLAVRRPDGSMVDRLRVELFEGESTNPDAKQIKGVRWIDGDAVIVRYCFEPYSSQRRW